MRKVFNKVEVEKFCSAFENKYGYTCEPDFIYYKTFFKKFNLKDIHFVNIVYELSNENEKEEIVKSYFPSKYEEMVSTYGKGNFYVKHFLYSETDNKIHCIIKSNTGDERHFKLKTDNYSDRIIEKINSAKRNIQKKLNKFYGYWIDDAGDGKGWYITDGNIHNGKYKKIYNSNISETIWISKII